MRAGLQWISLAAMLLVPAGVMLSARQGGGGGGQSGLPPDMLEGARQETPFEQFALKLKLDDKTQVPAAREIFLAAAQEAGPVGTQVLQARQRILNVALSDNPAEMKAATDAYTAAAAKMAAIEAAAFQKVYATLKPNQQANAAQAFTLMAGIFQPPAPSGGRGGGRRGGVQ